MLLGLRFLSGFPCVCTTVLSAIALTADFTSCKDHLQKPSCIVEVLKASWRISFMISPCRFWKSILKEKSYLLRCRQYNAAFSRYFHNVTWCLRTIRATRSTNRLVHLNSLWILVRNLLYFSQRHGFHVMVAI